MDKKELQELEDEHNRKLRDLERLEMDLDDYYHKFSRETDMLLEIVALLKFNLIFTKSRIIWMATINFIRIV